MTGVSATAAPVEPAATPAVEPATRAIAVEEEPQQQPEATAKNLRGSCWIGDCDWSIDEPVCGIVYGIGNHGSQYISFRNECYFEVRKCNFKVEYVHDGPCE